MIIFREVFPNQNYKIVAFLHWLITSSCAYVYDPGNLQFLRLLTEITNPDCHFSKLATL
jgi:hypothetical protein